jgi:hypothetical protein
MRNDDLAAEVARLGGLGAQRVRQALMVMRDSAGAIIPPPERMVRAGEMDLAHPMGLLVQFAGLAPSSRRWSRNRLARLMGGCAPNSLM